MTEPTTFTTKPTNSVQAMFFGGTVEQMQAVADWVREVVGETAIVDFTDWMKMLYVEAPGVKFNATVDTYIYLDADGLHWIDKAPFEALYAPES